MRLRHLRGTCAALRNHFGGLTAAAPSIMAEAPAQAIEVPHKPSDARHFKNPSAADSLNEDGA